MSIVEIVIASLCGLGGVRSVVVWLRRPFEPANTRDRLAPSRNRSSVARRRRLPGACPTRRPAQPAASDATRSAPGVARAVRAEAAADDHIKRHPALRRGAVETADVAPVAGAGVPIAIDRQRWRCNQRRGDNCAENANDFSVHGLLLNVPGRRLNFGRKSSLNRIDDYCRRLDTLNFA